MAHELPLRLHTLWSTVRAHSRWKTGSKIYLLLFTSRMQLGALFPFARTRTRKVRVTPGVRWPGSITNSDPDLAVETVILWWASSTTSCIVEMVTSVFGPYAPLGGPIPL